MNEWMNESNAYLIQRKVCSILMWLPLSIGGVTSQKRFKLKRTFEVLSFSLPFRCAPSQRKSNKDSRSTRHAMAYWTPWSASKFTLTSISSCPSSSFKEPGVIINGVWRMFKGRNVWEQDLLWLRVWQNYEKKNMLQSSSLPPPFCCYSCCFFLLSLPLFPHKLGPKPKM